MQAWFSIITLCGLKVETDPDQILSLLMGYMGYRIEVGRKDKQV